MNERAFVTSWVSKLASAGINNFPADFIPLNCKNTEIRLPGKTLIIGEEFFGKYEILTTDGNSVLHAENYYQAKSLIYANRTTPEIVILPSDETNLKKAVQCYESYLDSIIKKIETEYEKIFPEVENSKTVVNEIFKQLNLVRV
jgi:hypothetical protein